jgi:hypothetical protein
MFSNRTIAAFGAFSMLATAALTAHAQPRHHSKAADTDSDPDPDADADSPKPKTKARTKAKARTKSADPDADADSGGDGSKPKSRTKTRGKAKAKARDMDADSDAEADAEAEREKEREREREKEREAERERAREKEAADAEAAKQKTREKATETASDATSGNGAGGGEAYQSGTLGFSIPFTVIGAATGGGGVAGEPVPAVDIVYFLDDKAALDLIVGLNLHRGHTVSAMGAASDSTLIGAAAGLGYRMYSSKNGLRSFLEPQAVIRWPDTSNTDALSVNIGGTFGVERNLTPWFSVSGAVGVTLNLASKFKDIQLASAATLAANLYWR